MINTLNREQDTGLVVYDTVNNLYYTGLGWKKQLRNAKIYHSSKYAEDVIKSNTDRSCVLRKILITTI